MWSCSLVQVPVNDDAEATKENVAGTALEELVAERALCIPQTFSKFGLNWHAVVSDIKVEPPVMLAINDLMDHQAVTLTVTLRQEKCQSRERRPNIECAANLTPEAKAQFESMWVQAPTLAIRAPELIEQAMTTLAQETLQAVCPLGTPTPRQPWVTAHSWAELRIHSIARQAYWRSVIGQKEAVKQSVFEVWRGVSERGDGVVTGGNEIAAARFETARLGKLLRPLARSSRCQARQG